MKHILTLLTALLLVPLAALHAAGPFAIDLTKRTWQGIPGLERTAKGRVFVAWFTGGPTEPAPENTVLLSHSDDGGKTFTAPQAMALPLNDGTRCFDPGVWIDPTGRLWYFFLTAQISADDGATWNDGLLLDERKGVSYPDGVQDHDGLNRTRSGVQIP